MLQIDTLRLGSLRTNCYVVRKADSSACVVIDPGDEPEHVAAFLKEKGLSLEAILLTHGHFDHVGGVQALAEATGCALWLSESDWSQTPSPFVLQLFPIINCDFCTVNFPEEGETIRAAGLSFRVHATPGHTSGSVCYECEDCLFTGDTLFCGSCGRTDLPGGSHTAMAGSLTRLRNLPGDFRVFPGHGKATTLALEKQENPYMQP